MDLQIAVYALLAAGTTVVAGIAARSLTSGSRIQTLAWLMVGVLFAQVLLIAGLRAELTGAFVIAAAIATSWTFMRRMVIRPRA